MNQEKWTKSCYVAGPYRADSVWLKVQNIRKAEEISARLWYYGWVPLCPHKNAELFEGAYGLDHEVFLKGDLVLLSQCAIVVVIPGWRYSPGTLKEIEYAKELGKPIYFWENEKDRWFLEHEYMEWRD